MSANDGASPRSRVRAILHEAMDLPAARRRAFVEARLPQGDTLEDALGLLGELEDLGDFLEAPSLPAAFEPLLPTHVGAYEVERVLGWGSMGVVYLAAQQSPSRSVAVKVLRLDVASPVMARRFAQEGEVLARLTHAGIASVFEAGTADLGAGPQPFLAMEYVDGLPVIRYAEEHALSMRERVQLVAGIARAVAHAHDRGVLHRDLKPDNVLVRANGEPCVLDFGVAHIASTEGSQPTLTMTGQVIGTLAYMAPEQARGSDLDAKADQFALGAILYELLTGELPFDVRGRLPHESLRIIADGDSRPPTQFVQALAGDLEAILLTALAAEPVRRYVSVRALAEDLDRYLAGQPIRARPPSSVESLWRFIRRNAVLSVVVLVSILSLGALSAWGVNSLMAVARAEGGRSLFSDAQLRSVLVAEADRLWPTSGAEVAGLESWVTRAKGIQSRMSAHRKVIRSMESAAAGGESGGTSMDSLWLQGEGSEMLSLIENLLDEQLPEMERRLKVAQELRERTILDHREAWEAAARRVALDQRFAGYRLDPIEGLVPLGADSESGLEEFAVYRSGDVPTRDLDTHKIRMVENGAVVLVLIPGGDVWIGGQNTDPDGSRYDPVVVYYPAARGNGGPPFQLRLEPYLLSKYELTQAQWISLAGSNPSEWAWGSSYFGNVMGPTHPVDTVTWEAAMLYLPRLGLTLPTEAQWEAAALAGTDHSRMMGDSYQTLLGYANWGSHKEFNETDGPVPLDAYESHRPVGDLLPNLYGLHDMLGNVWELCRDVYKVAYHTLDHRAGDGLVIAEPDGDVSRRGLGSAASPAHMRVWTRDMRKSYGCDVLTGIRPLWADRPLIATPAGNKERN